MQPGVEKCEVMKMAENGKLPEHLLDGGAMAPPAEGGPRDPNDKLFAYWCRASTVVPPTTDLVLLGVPFDGAVLGRPGARGGPAAIREALAPRTIWDPLTGVDLADKLQVLDAGNVKVAPHDTAETHRRTEEAVAAITAAGASPVVLGGDHSISYATVRGMARGQGAGPVGILQFDAHHDVRETYDGFISSGTPFRRLMEDDPCWVDPGAFVQIGISPWRNSQAYTEYLLERGATIIGAGEFHDRGVEATMGQALSIVGEPGAGFIISFDLDVLDGPYGQGTSAPSPGGLTPYQAFRAVRMAAAHPACLGMDVVELAPNLDRDGWTAAAAAALVLEFMAGRALAR